MDEKLGVDLEWTVGGAFEVDTTQVGQVVVFVPAFCYDGGRILVASVGTSHLMVTFFGLLLGRLMVLQNMLFTH